MYFVYMYIYISYIRKSGARHGYLAAPGPGEAISHGQSSPRGGGTGEEPREPRDGWWKPFPTLAAPHQSWDWLPSSLQIAEGNIDQTPAARNGC